MEKDEDTNTVCKEWTGIEEDTKTSDQKGGPTMLESAEEGAAAAGSAPSADSEAGAGTPASEPTTPTFRGEATITGTPTDAALNIISNMMNVVRNTNESINSDSMDSQSPLKQFSIRTHIEHESTDSSNNQKDAVNMISYTERLKIRDCELDKITTYWDKNKRGIGAIRSPNFTFKNNNSDIITHGKVTTVKNSGGHLQNLSSMSEGPKVMLRFVSECNTPNNTESMKSPERVERGLSKSEEQRIEKNIGEAKRLALNSGEKGLSRADSEVCGRTSVWSEHSTSETSKALGDDSLDSLLACAAADASRHGNPLRRLREILRRDALPPSENVRPALASELISGRFDYLWSNLGLLRRYQDPLRRAPSSSALSNDDAMPAAESAATTVADLEDYSDFTAWPSGEDASRVNSGNTLSGDSTSAIDRNKLDASPTSQELRCEALDGKTSSTVVCRSNTRNAIWYTDSDAQCAVDNSLKGIRKRVRVFFKHLFRFNKHDKENVSKK